MTRAKAVRLAVEALKRWRCDYAVGHNALVEGREFTFAEREHKKYEELTEAIEKLEKG